MARTIEFSHLLDEIPQVSDPPSIRTDGEAHLFYVRDAEQYIEPSLRLDKGFDWSLSGLLLVTAPAAMGKTAFARHLAYKTGAPLWDLSLVDVGANSLSGALLDHFESSHVDRFIARTPERSDMFLIMDALDEAQLRVTEGSFEAFLNNVFTRLGAPNGRCTG